MQLLERLRERVTRTESAEPASTSIPPKVMYEVMQNERRRRIVEYLALTDSDEVAVGDIADYMASEYAGEKRNKAYISAIQNHAPVLDEVGLADYKRNRKILCPEPALTAVWQAHQQVKEELG